MAGSGLFTRKKPLKEHLAPAAGAHGLEGEVADLRKDIGEALLPLAAITVDDYAVAPATAAAAGLKAATATVAAAVTVLKAALLAPGLAALAAYGRNVTFTTAGATASDAPASATITGIGMDGKVLTETVNLAQTATIANGAKIFKDVTKIDFLAADGVGATIAIGFGVALGLSKVPLARGGGAVHIREIIDGAAVATGVLSTTNRSFTPATAPNAAHTYAIYYEFDPNVT